MNTSPGEISGKRKLKYVPGKVYILALWLALTNCVLAAQPDSAVLKKRTLPDSLFYKTYYHKLQINTDFGSQFQEFQTWYPGDFTTVLRPNETYSLSFGVSYEWLDLSYTYTPPFINLNNDNKRKGETKRKSLSASTSFKQWNLQADVSSTKGFYLYNTKDYVPNWKPGDAYLIFPQLSMDQANLLLSYRTNPRFSTKAISGGAQRQIRSAWTLLPTLALQYFSSNAGDSSNSGTYTLERNYDINLIVPALYTWVLSKKTFISVGAGPSIGVDFFSADVLDSVNINIRAKGTRFSYGYLTRLNIGYNGDRFFAGIQGQLRNYTHSNGEEDRLSKTFYAAKLFVGYRFNPPKFLTKSKQWVDEKMNSIFKRKKE